MTIPDVRPDRECVGRVAIFVLLLAVVPALPALLDHVVLGVGMVRPLSGLYTHAGMPPAVVWVARCAAGIGRTFPLVFCLLVAARVISCRRALFLVTTYQVGTGCLLAYFSVLSQTARWAAGGTPWIFNSFALDLLSETLFRLAPCVIPLTLAIAVWRGYLRLTPGAGAEPWVDVVRATSLGLLASAAFLWMGSDAWVRLWTMSRPLTARIANVDVTTGLLDSCANALLLPCPLVLVCCAVLLNQLTYRHVRKVLTAILLYEMVRYAFVLAHVLTLGPAMARGGYDGAVTRLAVTHELFSHLLPLPVVLLVAWLWWPVLRRKQLLRDPLVPTCEKCGYNLTGNVSKRCPECGAAVPPPAVR